MKKTIINPHDKFFRAAMADVRVAKEFLEEHLPSEVLKQIDLNSIEICPDTYVDEDLKLSQSDVVIKALINKQPSVIYILLEHLSTIPAHMPLRMNKYLLKIWDSYRLQNNNKSSLIYPVIIPIIFYTGKGSYTGKLSMWELCGNNANLMHKIMSNPIPVINVNNIPDEQLRQRLFAGTMQFVMRYRFKQAFDEQLLKLIDNISRLALEIQDDFLLKLLHYILAIDEKHNTVQSLLMTIHDHAPPSLRGNIMGLAEKIYNEGEIKGEIRGEIKGEIRGEIKGRVKGILEVARNMLSEGTDPVFVAKVTGLPLDKIKLLQKDRTLTELT